ncbi:MAG: glycosyltransferase family 2 protein, partial [Candidatus Dormibacteria bacterium]
AATVVAGRTIPDPLDRPAGSVFDRTMRIENSEQARRYSTCNILYPTAVLADLGGFDESLAYYGEDTDLGWRAEAAGARLAFADGATVYHAVLRQGPWRALRERWRVGGIVRLVERHPGLRDELWEGHFWSRQHRQATLAWVGLLAAPLNPVTVAALAPWVRFARHRLVYHLSAQPRRRRLVDMAGLFALDSVEVAACATASIRRRTFFL